jgi:hypothetical protein
VSDARAVAAAFGLVVELIDLGDWGTVTLISEYDARARAIRVNRRALDAFHAAFGDRAADATRDFINLAIAHELYHHREAIGEVPRFATGREREAAADAYARATVPVGAALAEFSATRAAA